MTMESFKPLILIVDDMPTNIQVLAESLRDEYRIKVATSGQSALDIVAKQGSPDLILLDVMMPSMDGYEVCRQLKQNPDTNSIPVIFVTAMNEVSNEEFGFDLGAVDYIVKPFHPAIVRARLRNHLNLRQETTRLESMAWFDALTGIPNRRRFDETLEVEWKRAQRNGSPLSIILVDVDHFKNYNDHYGHRYGDDCLKKVATLLASTVTRAGDMVARYGGEEFVLLVPDTDIRGARQLAEQLCMRIEQQQIQHGHSAASDWVTISAGYASMIPSATESASALLEEADNMLYYAKRCGRNRVYGLHDLESG